MRKVKELEEENSRLKKIVADLSLDKQMLQDVFKKMFKNPANETAVTEKKREIIGSIYPEKLTFDGNEVRTVRINEAVRLIYSLDACSS